MWRLMIVSLLTIVALSLGLASCGGDDNNDDATAPTATTAAAVATATTGASTQPTTAVAPAGLTATTDSDEIAAVEASVDTVVVVLVERDRDRLRDLTGTGARDRLRDQDVDRLMTCVPEGATIEPLSRTVTIEGDTATVVVTLKVTDANGTASTVERTWLFERQDDGTWALAELPDCPVAP